MYRCRLVGSLDLSRSCVLVFFFSSRRRHTRLQGDWSSDVCSSDLVRVPVCWQPLQSALPRSGRHSFLPAWEFAACEILLWYGAVVSSFALRINRRPVKEPAALRC